MNLEEGMQKLEQITEQALDVIARNEGNPLEPAHIHVRNAESEAKFCLDENISIDGLLAGRGDVTHKPQKVA